MTDSMLCPRRCSFPADPYRLFSSQVLMVLAIGLLAHAPTSFAAPESSELDLAGVWQLALDPKDVGLVEQWYQPSNNKPYSLAAKLPGSLESQRIGNPVTVDTPWTGPITDRTFFTSPRYEPYRRPGQVKVPYFLQPETFYRGPAWRRRTVTIPDIWRGRRVELELERCHWTSRVWFDGALVGSGESLSAPHRFELTGDAQPGEHTLVVRVDNRMFIDVGSYAHSVTDHTQGNWNGVVGKVQLVSTPRVWVDRVAVFPDVNGHRIKIVTRLGNSTGNKQEGRLHIRVKPRGETDTARVQTAEIRQSVEPGGSETTVEAPLGDNVRLWDEFSPNLHEATAEWIPNDTARLATHEKTSYFGLRDLGTKGTQLTLNGRKLFLRGTLECNVFPLTGYPATDVAGWRRIMQVCRDYGLNHIRFHSNCPPEAAFIAADEAGMYLQIECAVWANWTSTIGNGEPVDDFLYREVDRIIAEYGNHPSFILMSHGNEPAGPSEGAAYLTKWIDHYRTRDPRRLYTGGSGWPMIPANQFHVTPQPRIYAWGAGEKSRINGHPPETRTDYREFIAAAGRPVVAHEIGQWCAYPDLDAIPKYSGHLKPHNLEIFRDFLAAEGLGNLARDFHMASGKLQVACYKEEIESALRTPGYAGFALLGLTDFPGQGTAVVGVCDAFWDAKPYVDSKTFRRFCQATVPLARMDRRYFTAADKMEADLELAHFGPHDLAAAEVDWRLENVTAGAVVEKGMLRVSAATGTLAPIGHVSVPLAKVTAPAKLRLTVGVRGTDAENDWDLWCYPAQPAAEIPAAIHICSELDDAALRRLHAGGKVLLMLRPDQVATDRVLGFSSIFWNTSWTDHQVPHTLGILCDPAHPLFAEFPTESHSNWQWWDLMHGAATMELDSSFAAVKPLVQVVPDWFAPKKLALAFEARLHGGSLVVTSMDLSSELERRPAARQFRTSLLHYMASDRFHPECEVSSAKIEALVR